MDIPLDVDPLPDATPAPEVELSSELDPADHATPIEGGAPDLPTANGSEATKDETQKADGAMPEAEPDQGDIEPGLRKLRVLAAEDNKTNQLVFRKMLKDLDLDLTFAANGQEAVQSYMELRPDMIFMDISMPIMDGREAAAEIRKIEAETGEHVPIIAMTAHTLSGDETEILASGIDHYLTKPLRKPLIHQKIAELLPQDVLPPIPVEIQDLAS